MNYTARSLGGILVNVETSKSDPSGVRAVLASSAPGRALAEAVGLGGLPEAGPTAALAGAPAEATEPELYTREQLIKMLGLFGVLAAQWVNEMRRNLEDVVRNADIGMSHGWDEYANIYVASLKARGLVAPTKSAQGPAPTAQPAPACGSAAAKLAVGRAFRIGCGLGDLKRLVPTLADFTEAWVEEYNEDVAAANPVGLGRLTGFEAGLATKALAWAAAECGGDTSTDYDKGFEAGMASVPPSVSAGGYSREFVLKLVEACLYAINNKARTGRPGVPRIWEIDVDGFVRELGFFMDGFGILDSGRPHAEAALAAAERHGLALAPAEPGLGSVGLAKAEAEAASDSEPDGSLFSAFRARQDACFDIFKKKQRDYGPGNISQSYVNFGAMSLLVRMNDKMQRLINLTKGDSEPNNESIEDSFNDLANYAMIGLLCISGEWPGTENAD